jgi:putative tryptophan/tyrosine transport system substrate-binding protein
MTVGLPFPRGPCRCRLRGSRNVLVEYRWPDGDYDKLPSLAADLVRRNVAVIATINTPSILAAKGATRTIPIVFAVGVDPIKFDLVESLNRPGGNLTGLTQLNVEMEAKRVQLLHELVPSATSIGLLVNPSRSCL